MLALHLSDKPELLRDLPLPSPEPGEALIGLQVAGICDTDLQLAQGYMQFRGVPGHEFVGEVLECDERAWVGKRVVGDINAGCGQCAACLEEDGHHCKQRSVLGILQRDGCLAERFTLPTRNLVEVPPGVPDEVAVFAEPLAAALHVLDELPSSQGAPVAVLGDGKLGLLIALALHASEAKVTLIGHHSSKLELAAAAGVACTLEADLPERGSDYGLVVEATGSRGGLERALQLARPRGTVVLKSTVAGPLELDLSPVVIHELRLIGSRCGNMQAAMELLASGAMDPRPLIQERFGLEQAVEALDLAGQRGVLKVLVQGTQPR